MGKRGRKPVTSEEWTTQWKARTEELSCLYQRLGTLEAVAKKVGITRERVRQILTKGRKRGVCTYSPRQALCSRLSQLPDVLKTSCTFEQAARRLGYANNVGLSFMIKRFNLSRRQITQQLARNRRTVLKQHLLERFQKHVVRLNTPEVSTTILEQDRAAKADYTRWHRQFGGIDTLRNALGVRVRKRKAQRWGDTGTRLSLAPVPVSFLEKAKKFLTSL